MKQQRNNHVNAKSTFSHGVCPPSSASLSLMVGWFGMVVCAHQTVKTKSQSATEIQQSNGNMILVHIFLLLSLSLLHRHLLLSRLFVAGMFFLLLLPPSSGKNYVGKEILRSPYYH